jgi:superfamily II DNA/RNA helicase
LSKSFQELGVSAPVVRALEAAGFTHPFAIQSRVLPDALAGLDVLAESPTGSGKTLAFALPLVERTAGSNARPGALVLCPTRELALQVSADIRPLAKAKGLRVETVYGGAPIGAQIKKARDAHILVATPGRLFDLIERRAVRLNDVRILVLDEADRMLDMGFKPQVDRILRSVPDNRQTMLFSATFDGAVAELARAYTVKASHVRAEAPVEAQRGEIDHTFVAVTAEDKLDRLVEQLRGDRGLALVFVRTKHGADKLARKLERPAQHQGGRDARQPLAEPARAAPWLSSSPAASRRSSRPMLPPAASTSTTSRTCINFDPPQGDNDYVHRVGPHRPRRAQRHGRHASSCRISAATSGRLATRLGHGDSFASSGMAVATRPKPHNAGGRQRRRSR